VSFRGCIVHAAARLLFFGVTLLLAPLASASTYVVYLPLNSPIYDQLDALNSLGYLDDYLDEIKPISRVEAARLTIQAQANFSDTLHPDMIARELIRDLRDQLHEEIGWIQSNQEDNPPMVRLKPVDRFEAQYIYSHGPSRFWRYGSGATSGNTLSAQEGTPLLPNNDGIPTAPGSNEVLSLDSWGGLGGFFTAYGETAITGPIRRTPPNTARVRPLDAEAVLGLGDWALSFGQEEMWWGPGHFEATSQSNNASPIPGFRWQNIHPSYLPGFLRYLGPFRLQIFFGRLDAGRTLSKLPGTSTALTFARPWIDGQVIAFKPLPTFEWGITHTIMFGGTGNNNYTTLGFLGRATGFNTGSIATGNTNSRAGIYLKFIFPRLRNSILFVESLGEDNLSAEVRPIGGILPFLAVTYHGGYYLPRVTKDGRTDFRFEWAIAEPNYSTHSDSLYWAYSDHLMGGPLGPNSSQMDFQLGRWIQGLTKGSVDFFVTDRAPKVAGNTFVPAMFYGRSSTLSHERSIGLSFDLLTIPESHRLRADLLSYGRTRVGFEYVDHVNFGPPSAFRAIAQITIGIKPNLEGFSWH
jgi:hypothetical protein